MNVKTQTCLTRHKDTGIYYFRRAVPKDLRKEIGLSEIKFSLDTSDPKRAKELVGLHLPRVSAQFEQARAKLNPQHRSSISRDEARQFAKAFGASLLAHDEDARIDGDRENLDLLSDLYNASTPT
jgi:hypothetical protein